MKNKIIAIIGVLILTFSISSCDDWLDVNDDPRNITDNNASVEVLLPPLLESCSAAGSPWPLYHWMGYWSHWNMDGNYGIVNYKNVQATDLYYFSATPPPEIFYLEKKAEQSNQLYYLGIAKVIRALKWSQSVDLVNNMPYSEAYNINILQPKYDSGLEIYEDCIRQLDLAQTLIKNANSFQSSDIANTDIMFHGDKTKWAKFINTLKLRLLVHQANRSDRQTYITNEIQKIITEGSGFIGTGEDASINLNYGGSGNNNYSRYFGKYSSHNIQFGGGFYDANYQFSSNQVAHANVYALELLKSDNDPRIELFYSTVDIPFNAGDPEPFTQSAPLDFRGNKFGKYIDTNVYPFQDQLYVSAIGGSRNTALVNPSAKGIIKGRDMSDGVITSVESMFLQAEAIQRNWISGDAEQAYLDAVKESFRWLNAGGNSNNPSLSDAIFQNWYDVEVANANQRVSWALALDKYKLLMNQKYMALNGIDPLETWNDYRRNGRFPDLPVSEATTRVGSGIPFRILYDQNEYLVNSNNVNAQGPTDMFTSKIWWMP